jgi:hypothetical protein
MRLDPSGQVPAMTVEQRVTTLDSSLFDYIPTETYPDDRKSLLALRAAVAERRRTFRYLEIGSHHGGTLQPLIVNRRCVHIASIDPRPEWQPDDRFAEGWRYPDNSTQRMLDMLADVRSRGPVNHGRASTSSVSMASSSPRPERASCSGSASLTAASASRRWYVARARSATAPRSVLTTHSLLGVVGERGQHLCPDPIPRGQTAPPHQVPGPGCRGAGKARRRPACSWRCLVSAVPSRDYRTARIGTCRESGFALVPYPSLRTRSSTCGGTRGLNLRVQNPLSRPSPLLDSFVPVRPRAVAARGRMYVARDCHHRTAIVGRRGL